MSGVVVQGELSGGSYPGEIVIKPFGPITRRQPYSLNVNLAHYLFRPKDHWESRNNVGSQGLVKRISDIRAGNLLIRV